MSDIGPEMRHCAVCKQPGQAPELVPYLGEGKSHVWAHQLCAWQAFGSRRDFIPEIHTPHLPQTGTER